MRVKLRGGSLLGISPESRTLAARSGHALARLSGRVSEGRLCMGVVRPKPPVHHPFIKVTQAIRLYKSVYKGYSSVYKGYSENVIKVTQAPRSHQNSRPVCPKQPVHPPGGGGGGGGGDGGRYLGKVERINDDGTVRVKFDDGDSDVGSPPLPPSSRVALFLGICSL